MSTALLVRQAALDSRAARAHQPRRGSESLSLIQRRQDIVSSLIGKNRHVLALAGSSNASVQWARDLRNWLVSAVDARLEVFVSGNAEAMIERFNDLLECSDLASARTPLESSSLERVVLVPDIRMLASSEGLLFTRLVASFPGAGVRLLVVADRDALAASDRVLDALARSLDIVELDGNDESPGAIAHKPADKTAQSVAAASRLAPGGAPSLRSDGWTVPARGREPESSAARRFDAVDFSREPEIVMPVHGQGAGWRRTLGWAAAFLSLLLVSALVVVLLHRDKSPGGKGKTDESVRALSAPVQARDSSAGGRGR